jgi:hypothetical protein
MSEVTAVRLYRLMLTGHERGNWLLQASLIKTSDQACWITTGVW